MERRGAGSGTWNKRMRDPSSPFGWRARAGFGDFNGDGSVTFDDFFLFADHFGREEGEGDFDSLFDLNGDGAVSFDDFFILADHFGQQADRR